jgi:hypothetical protein
VRIGRRLHAVGHLFGADDLLARTVPASLGADLVFDMAGGGAELDQALHGARDVECARAEAGVDVHQQRQLAHIGDAAHIGQHVVERVDAQVGQTERTGRHTAAGQVDRAVAGTFGEQRVVGVDRADDLQRRFLCQRGTERGPGGDLTHRALS